MTVLSIDEGVDFHRTPEYETRRFLSVLAPTIKPRRILEPCAGDGAIANELRRRWPAATVDAFDIMPRGDGVVGRPFYVDDEPGGYDLVLTNPPFSIALEFAFYCLAKRNPGGVLALLLPMDFFGSQERYHFNTHHRPHHVYQLHERVSFSRDGKTDSRYVGWFVWRENGGRSYTTRWTLL